MDSLSVIFTQTGYNLLVHCAKTAAEASAIPFPIKILYT